MKNKIGDTQVALPLFHPGVEGGVERYNQYRWMCVVGSDQYGPQSESLISCPRVFP